MYLEATQDAGDTYDFSPKIGAQEIMAPKSAKCLTESDTQVSKLVTSLQYSVNEDLNSKVKITQAVKVTIAIINETINFKINMKNEAKDIRWRFVLNTNQSNKTSFADQALSLIERPVFETEKMQIWEAEKWKDMPVAIENFSKFVYVKTDNNKIIGVKSNDLNEYELIGEKFDKLALTLFRGVSLIGRRDLLFRPGRASGINDYPHATPESNLNKELKFEFDLLLNKDFDANQIYDSLSYADFYQNQNISDYLWIGQTFWRAKVACKNNQPAPLNIFKNVPTGVVVSALKLSYDEKHIICRIANLSENDFNLKNHLNDYELFETNALEKEQSQVTEILKKNEIKTLIVKLK
ncbi:alpha-mannosidase [Spiroplasma clarkii]|uniref:glycosyl hydrolase-related protein n=1 Tax=Spiroplasma clarkii TaxID=2139 RepID=UPI000B5723E2|nr:glycosyl hydrolase-related protein [Spiroplasma clarkii]ARU91034.1 alpha-mannosidase [Spiroplasma clarkii]